MRRNFSSTRGVVTAVLAGTALLFWSAISFAGTPTLGADCGSGASVAGSDSAGKVTLGQGTDSTCTITFSVPYTNAPACTASNETNGGANSIPVGTRTTSSTVVVGGLNPWIPGDVISYLCLEY